MTRGSGFFAAFHRCFGCRLPFIASPAARRLMRVLALSLWTVYFLFVLLVLSLRYCVLPQIEDYRSVIERMAGDGIGRKVSIGRVEAGWAGIHPDLTLYDVSVADAQGRAALTFSRVETVLSWRSVAQMRLRLCLLRIDEPTLHVRRDGDGRFFVAGVPLAGDGGGGGRGGNGIPSWVLDQRRIRIDGATRVWEDVLRGAPPLVLEDVNIALDNDGGYHRFGLTALPADGLASRVEVRGEFSGGDSAAPGRWRGQLFAEIGRADLAVWKRWVDYPLALSRGRGAARVWLDFADGRLREVTADMALRDVDPAFGEALPALPVESLSGRLQADFPAGGLAVKGRGVTLLSRAAAREAQGGEGAIRIDPADFELVWRTGQESGASGGSAEISALDIGMLARLAAHLPLDARWRQWLDEYAPRGRIGAFHARWSGDARKVHAYSLKTGVQNLGARAKGYSPGFSGLTGVLEATETGGRVILNSRESSLDLPAVFPEPLIRLDSLSARASWKIDGNALEVDLEQADFAGPEAAGSVKGTYRTADDGPGVVDLAAALERADARAVWRYMPHVVNPDARRWLRASLLAGEAGEARLILKGNLKDFPFLDKRLGQFLVTVKTRDVVLDYGAGWPRIDGIAGDLRFEGHSMTIEARQGRILGARLANTEARIPDLDAPVPMLLVKGQAIGPTAEFLKFIERSPVAGAIDHFTEEMRATGNGRLDIELSIPLDERRLEESRVAGVYRFMDNEVTVDTALPPLSRVNGSLRFSGGGLEVPEITASLFGGPLNIRGGMQKDGRVLIMADGLADVDRLRRQSPHPVLAGLSGTAPYRGEVRISGRHADLMVESDLVGLRSTLPEPFAKAADEALPLRFEKRRLDADDAAGAEAPPRDRISVSLGTLLEARAIRRKTSGGFTPERGALVIGRPLRVPETGLALGVSAKRLDLDAWRAVFDAMPSGKSGEIASAWLPGTIDLRADDLFAGGMSWNGVDLSASRTKGRWLIRVDSRQMAGEVVWNGTGDGRLVARLGRLAIERLPPHSGTAAGEPARRLPALDVVADGFTVRRLDFGRLEVQASNDGAGWNLDRIEVSNLHGALSGKGSWRRDGGAGRTRLSFKLESSDVGGLLARTGYPETVRDGTARLDGTLAWNGAPTELDYASMRGDLKLEAAKGQFLKLDPGAAGKLLGLVSLQNLPRRISLDFKDVFSEGLAFDAISGKMAVQDGIMRTDRLRIDSPSARITMRGEVDLARETQRLEVTVRPEVGDTAAVGMAIVHPAAGVATWLANKVLKNPLGAMFGYQYLVTGAWDDPKVEKLTAESAGETLPEGSP
jgi:uncharacterized protein (TIGR02099 family)